MNRSKRTKRNVLLVMICAVIWLVGLLGSFPNMPVSADNSLTYSDVMSDLKGSTVDGKPFAISDYGYDSNGVPQVFSFAEYCFSVKEETKSKYALFVYVYNPSGEKISEDGNKLQIASEYSWLGSSPYKYSKFDLEFCSKSTDPDCAELFYKFKIIDNDNIIYDRVASVPTSRRYDISGIEILFEGSSLATEYAVGGTYTYSGYAVGCDETYNAESTLACKVTDVTDMVRLKVNSTYWRTGSSSMGKSYRNQLNSVYFSLPNELLNTAGRLKSIHASWYETITTSCVATTSDSFYKAYSPPDGEYHAGANHFGWAFYVNSLDEHISSKQMRDYMNDHDKKCKADSKDYNVFSQYPGIFGSHHLFESESSFGQSSLNSRKERKWGFNDIVISADSKYDLLSYSDTHGFWDKVDDFGFWDTVLGRVPKDEGFKDVKPIETVDYSKYSGYSENNLASSLYVDCNDASDFHNYVDTAWRNNETPVLFRFGVTQYYSEKTTDVSYMFKTSAFLNFDIIDLCFFSEEGKSVVIAAISDPINIIPGSDPPVVYETMWDKFMSWVKNIMGKLFGVSPDSIPDWLAVLFLVVSVIVIGFLFILLMPFMPMIGSFLAMCLKGLAKCVLYLFKGIIYVLSLPVCGIIALIRHIRGDA